MTRFAVAAIAIAAATSWLDVAPGGCCGGSRHRECSSDSDCSDGRKCLYGGRCVTPPPAESARPATSAAPGDGG